MEKEKIVQAIKDENKKQAVDRISMTEEEAEINRECLEAASMPNELTDEDFKLGNQELDIRGLSKENKEQIFFRLLATQMSQTRQLTQIVIDMERLIMLLLGTRGIQAKEIGVRINKLIDELTQESEKMTRHEQKN